MNEAFECVGLFEDCAVGDGFEFFREEFVETCAEALSFNAAVFEDFCAAVVFDERIEEVLDAEIFVVAGSCFTEGGLHGGF